MLSRQCNLRCTYCIEGDKTDAGVLAFQTAVRRLGELEDGSQIEFTGGEPLLHTSLIMRILDWSRSAGRHFLWAVTTNGQARPGDRFIDEYLMEFSKIRVSIDGPRPLHDIHRGPGSFDRAYRFVAALLDHELMQIDLSPTFTRRTIPLLDQTAAWFLETVRSFGFPQMTFNLNVADRLLWNIDDYAAFRRALEQTLTWYAALNADARDLFKLGFVEERLHPPPRLLGYFAACPAGISSFAVSPDGAIGACIADLFGPHPPEKMLLASFTAEHPYRRLTLQRDFVQCFECANPHCGPCPSLFNKLTGDPCIIPQNYCTFGKITAEVVADWLQN